MENQVITADAFSDGSQSLKIAKEPSVSGQVNAVIGGFYTYAEPISTENATFSADIYINEQSNSSLSLVFALVDLAANKFRTYINFAYGGVAEVLVKGSTPGMITVASTGFQWSPMTWYNVKIQTIGATVQFSVDGVQIFEGELPSAGPVSQVRFIHDNYNGFAYIDNFRTNAEELSTNDFTITSLKHFYNQQNQTLSLNSLNNLTNIEVYNTLGQIVLTQKLSAETENISLSNLASGTYIAKVSTGTAHKSIKIVKN